LFNLILLIFASKNKIEKNLIDSLNEKNNKFFRSRQKILNEFNDFCHELLICYIIIILYYMYI